MSEIPDKYSSHKVMLRGLITRKYCVSYISKFKQQEQIWPVNFLRQLSVARTYFSVSARENARYVSSFSSSARHTQGVTSGCTVLGASSHPLSAVCPLVLLGFPFQNQGVGRVPAGTLAPVGSHALSQSPSPCSQHTGPHDGLNVSPAHKLKLQPCPRR